MHLVYCAVSFQKLANPPVKHEEAQIAGRARASVKRAKPGQPRKLEVAAMGGQGPWPCGQSVLAMLLYLQFTLRAERESVHALV